MKNYIKKYIYFILFSLTCPLFARDCYEEVYKLAQNLEKSGAVKEAALEYKRYLFLQDYTDESGSFISNSYEALSNYYESSGELEKAIEYNRLLINCKINESDEAGEISKPFILRDILLREKLAQQNKTSLEQDVQFFTYLYLSPDSEIQKLCWQTLLSNLVDTENWDKLETTFYAATSAFPALFSNEQQKDFFTNLNSIFAFKPKKPMLAAHLSFIPGLGQLYAHNPKDALNAFLVNGTFITLEIYSICTQNYFDTLFETDPLIRFYKGNLYNAQKDVYLYNEQQISIYKENLLKITRHNRKNGL